MSNGDGDAVLILIVVTSRIAEPYYETA